MLQQLGRVLVVLGDGQDPRAAEHASQRGPDPEGASVRSPLHEPEEV